MTASSPATHAASDVRIRSGVLSQLGDYVALTRPRVLSLVLFTAPAAMALGREHWPGLHVLAGVVIGVAATRSLF